MRVWTRGWGGQWLAPQLQVLSAVCLYAHPVCCFFSPLSCLPPSKVSLLLLIELVVPPSVSPQVGSAAISPRTASQLIKEAAAPWASRTPACGILLMGGDPAGPGGPHSHPPIPVISIPKCKTSLEFCCLNIYGILLGSEDGNSK